MFEGGRYWGVEVTYAKASATDVLMRVSIENHGPDPARLHVLPSLWFRNTWRWHDEAPPGSLGLDGDAVTVAGHPRLAGYRLQAAAAPDGTTPTALFCDNETNLARLYGVDPATSFPKDGIGDHVVHGAASVNPAATGTKAAWWYPLDVPGGGRTELRLRLSRPEPARPDRAAWAGASFDEVVAARTAEADDFYDALGPDLDEDDRRILRQASAGLVWSKQMYPYRVESWLDGDPGEPPPPIGHRYGRNVGWRHLDSFDVLAMPDPWEYPWFAAWDLGFHAVAWAHLDPAFAKYQMLVLLREWFIHPNGAIPSYEWSFDDVNPPVQAMAAIRIFQIDGHQDVAFLKRAFHKLLLNFTWWLNRQDPDGNNVFGGGFLGLDNISPVDRSHLPPGVHIEQADGTAWMAYYSLAMLFIAVHLARHDDDVYEDMVVKFLEQFVLIVDAIERVRHVRRRRRLLLRPDHLAARHRAHPGADAGQRHPGDHRRRHRPARPGPHHPAQQAVRPAGRPATGPGRRRGGPPAHGRRRPHDAALDRVARAAGHDSRRLLRRGRVPVPPRAAVDLQAPREALRGAGRARGDDLLRAGRVADQHVRRQLQLAGPGVAAGELPGRAGAGGVPPGAGRRLHDGLPDRLGRRAHPRRGRRRPHRPHAVDLAAGPDGRRPVFGGVEVMQSDPAWRDNLLFFEYFHGDDGAGLGASHQTGWTALVVDLLLDRPGGPRPDGPLLGPTG